MNIDQLEVQRLRRALSEEPSEASRFEDCPAPEEIWEAVQGNLSRQRLSELVDHSIHCPQCAEEWRLAVELSREEVPVDTSAASPKSWYQWRTPLAAAAALLLIVLGWAANSLFWQPAPGFRGSGVELSSPVDGRSLPRDGFLLRWDGAPAGSHYELLVTTEDLKVIEQLENLSANHYQIPAQDLLNLPTGSRILWQVKVIPPDGAPIQPERTFVSIVGE